MQENTLKATRQKRERESAVLLYNARVINGLTALNRGCARRFLHLGRSIRGVPSTTKTRENFPNSPGERAFWVRSEGEIPRKAKLLERHSPTIIISRRKLKHHTYQSGIVQIPLVFNSKSLHRRIVLKALLAVYKRGRVPGRGYCIRSSTISHPCLSKELALN